MKKQELLNYFDDELLDRLFGFCYARTNDSYEAQELCSDIIFALVKAAHTDGQIENPYAFLWRVARNVYADFSKNRKRYTDMFYNGESDELLSNIAAQDDQDDSAELLNTVYRRIAFLTHAYREAMILFYIDGMSVAQIAKHLNTSESAIRQRLFSARQKIRNEVEQMTQTENKPVALDKIEYEIWGTGNPGWSDPRTGFERMFSKHIVWLCHQKPMSASEIAQELNVPTVYVEEELELLVRGENGRYGLLRRLENGKYALNFILLDTDVFEQATALYKEQLPLISETITAFIEKHKEEYLSFPYLNKKVDLDLVLWQQISRMARIFSNQVEDILEEEYFSDRKIDRPFSVFGYVNNGQQYGGGWDGVEAHNICGFSQVHFDNIYITRIKKHFHCEHNVSQDPQLQLTLRAIDGLDIGTLTEQEKEHAAKAIECGYLYREGEMLYTKILVSTIQDRERLFAVTNGLSSEGCFTEQAHAVAEKLAALIRRAVPDYLIGEWRLANILADMPVLDSLVEVLIEKGILTPPKDGIGAQGCWVSVEK